LRRREESPDDSLADRAARQVIWRHVTPRWLRHLESIIERERGVDAVIVFGIPMSHLRGIPTALRERFGVPVVYYDPDVPMSLPEFGGMDTGFNIYHGADPGEYDLVLSNSEGGLDRLRELGARRVDHLFWGADPDLFYPRPVENEYDVFFYGYGRKFRQEWIDRLLVEPSRRLPTTKFAVGGADLGHDLGRVRMLGYVMASSLAEAISAARVNINVARKPHASVYASSTCRLFELAAAGATIVTNPYEGVERWFEPGTELLVVGNADEAVETLRMLLEEPALASELGRRARERVLEEHTSLHRARRLLDLIGVAQPSRTTV
jgi:spore maturation protein CgeB